MAMLCSMRPALLLGLLLVTGCSDDPFCRPAGETHVATCGEGDLRTPVCTPNGEAPAWDLSDGPPRVSNGGRPDCDEDGVIRCRCGREWTEGNCPAFERLPFEDYEALEPTCRCDPRSNDCIE